MNHTAFAFGLASLVAACAAQPRHPLSFAGAGNLGQAGHVASATTPTVPIAATERRRVVASPVMHPVLAVSSEIAMPVDDVHTWLTPAPADPRALRRRERRDHARRHDAAVRAGLATLLVGKHGHDGTRTGLATLLAPAPGQAYVSLQRPLLGRDERPMPGNVMAKPHGKSAGPDWTDE